MVELKPTNFEFISAIYPDVYGILLESERKSRIDFQASAQLIRQGLERFLDYVTTSHKLRLPFEVQKNLKTKLTLLCSQEELLKAGYKPASVHGGVKLPLPYLGTVQFNLENGQRKEDDYYQFIRKLGNSASHGVVDPQDVKLNYDHIVKAFKGLHKLFQLYFANKLPKDIQPFDEYYMPIDNYSILESFVPQDSVRSKCLREFHAVSLDTSNYPENYAIIRLYNKEQTDSIFLLRNQKAFVEASKSSASSVPEGMVALKELTPHTSNKSNYYMVVYTFNQEPHQLRNHIIKEMSLEDRMDMCRSIVNCLYNLHTSENQIYHRMLNHECVYVSKIRGKYTPYIVKFDYAKILTTTNQPILTVFDNAVKAKNRMKENHLNKYLPPEWHNIVEKNSKMDWEKVDIYSLGILLSDILYGTINSQIVDLEELENLSVSKDIVDLLDWMRAESPQERCNMQMVKDLFNERRKPNDGNKGD